MKKQYMQKSFLKVFSFVLIFSLFLFNITVTPFIGAAAAGIIADGTCGENAEWTLTTDGVLTVSGSGDMSFSEAPWVYYKSKISTVVIEDGITRVEEAAFNDYPLLKKVVIHGTVDFFDDMAFSFCTNIEKVYFDSIDCLFKSDFGAEGEANPLANKADLYIGNKPATEITVPSYVKNIGLQLSGGKNIKKITIPSGVVSIDNSAFASCEALESITLPETLTQIGPLSFLCCYALKEIEIPDSVKSIGYSAFKYCHALEKLKLPKRMERIESKAFEDCYKLKSITLSDGIKQIGSYAFAGCKSLSSISLPDTVEVIGSYAFYFCESLKSISLHSSIKKIGTKAFQGCPLFTDIYFYGTVTQWNDAEIIVDAYYNRQTKVHFVNCAHKDTAVAPMEKPSSIAPGYTEGVYCNDCRKFISGHQEIPKTDSPFMNSESAKIIDDMVYLLPGVSYSELIAHSDPGSYILVSGETGLEINKLPGTGMILVGLNGKRNAIIVMGDADGNGKATASDARLALRLSVGLEQYEKNSSVYKALNVDGGEVTSSDARAILRASVFIEKLKLPAGN